MADRIQTDLIVKAIAEGFDQVADEMSDVVKSQEQLTIEQKAGEARARDLTQQLNELGKAVADGSKTVDEATREYDEFSDELNDLTKGAKDAGGATKLSITDIKSAIDLGTAAFREVAEAARFAYAQIKEGAELELAKRRFGLLSESIGTTADALLIDLRAATEGMRSDAELMAGAGEIMSLGLVDTADQAVRLTNIISALGADMNQVVLTLTNRTVARFDQIGIAVDGFDEKVGALIATGMSTEDAFSEAFLQQGEAQIEKVGSVAETSAGQIMQLESEVANLKNTMKAALAESLTPFLVHLNDEIDRNKLLVDAMEKGIITFDEYIKARDEMSAADFEFEAANEATQEQLDAYNETMERATDLTWRYTEASGEYVSTTQEALLTTSQFTQTLGDSSSAVDLYRMRAEKAAKQSQIYGQHIRDNITTVEESTTVQDIFNASLASTASRFGSVNTGIASTIQNLIEQAQFLAAGGGEIVAATDAIIAAAQSGDITFDQAEQELQDVGIAALDLEAELTGMSVEELATRLMALGLGPEEADVKAQELTDTLFELTSQPHIIDVIYNISVTGSPPTGAPGIDGGGGNDLGGGIQSAPNISGISSAGGNSTVFIENVNVADGTDFMDVLATLGTEGARNRASARSGSASAGVF